jgi:hypothetical protein
MRPRKDAVARGVKGLAGAAVNAARRSAPPRAWRSGVELLIKLQDMARPLEEFLDACSEAVDKELEELQINAGELVRTRSGLIDAADLDSYMKKENYLPPGCDRTWEGTVVIFIDVTHPDPSAAPSPWAVLPAAMGRFTAFRWETYDPDGELLSKGEFLVPKGGYPNTMLHEIARHAAFTFAQDGPDAWTGLWDGRPPPPGHADEEVQSA